MDQEFVQRKKLSLMEELQADLRAEDMKSGFNIYALEEGQERTKKGKTLSNKIKGLRALADKVKARGTVVATDMLSKKIISGYGKKYGLSKKDMERMINDMQNGDYLETEEETTEILQNDGVNQIEADIEELEFSETKRSKISKVQNMSEEHLAVCQELGRILEAKRTALGITENSMRMVNLEESDIREFKRYGLSKKEVEKLSKDIQTGTLRVYSYTVTPQVEEEQEIEETEVQETVKTEVQETVKTEVQETVEEQVTEITEEQKIVVEEQKTEEVQEIVEKEQEIVEEQETEEVQEIVEKEQEIVEEQKTEIAEEQQIEVVAKEEIEAEIEEEVETQKLQEETVEIHEEALKSKEDEIDDSSKSEDLEEAEKEKIIRKINALFEDYLKQSEITDAIKVSKSYEKSIEKMENLEEVYEKVEEKVATYLNYMKYYIYRDLSIKKYGYVLDEDNDDNTELLNEFNDLYSKYKEKAKESYNQTGLTAFEIEENLENVYERCYSMKMETKERIQKIKNKIDSLKSMWEEQQREEESKRKIALKERRKIINTINNMYNDYMEDLDFECDVEASENYDEMIAEMNSLKDAYDVYREGLKKQLAKIRKYMMEELSLTNYGSLIKSGEEGYEDLKNSYNQLCSKIQDIYNKKGLRGFENAEELEDFFARCYAMDRETLNRIRKLKDSCLLLEEKKKIAQEKAQKNAQREQRLKQQREKKETTVIKITKETVTENPAVELHMLQYYKEYFNSLKKIDERKRYLNSLVDSNSKQESECKYFEGMYLEYREELAEDKQSECDKLLNEYINEVKNKLQNGDEIVIPKFGDQEEREMIYRYACEKVKYEFSNSIMSVVDSEIKALSKRMTEFFAVAKEYRDILQSNIETYNFGEFDFYYVKDNVKQLERRIRYIEKRIKEDGFDTDIICENILENVVKEVDILARSFKDINKMFDSVKETEKIQNEGEVDLAEQVSKTTEQEVDLAEQVPDTIEQEEKQKIQVSEEIKQDTQLQEELFVNEKPQQQVIDKRKEELQKIRSDISKLAEAWNNVENRDRFDSKHFRNEYINRVIMGMLNKEIVSEEEMAQYIDQYADENKTNLRKMRLQLRYCISTGSTPHACESDNSIIYYFEKHMKSLEFNYETVNFMMTLLKIHGLEYKFNQ